MWFCIGFSVGFSVQLEDVIELHISRLGHCWWAWSSQQLLLVSFLFWQGHACRGGKFVQGHNISPWCLSPWHLTQDLTLWTNVLGFRQPFQGHNLSWYDVDWETVGVVVDINVVGVVQAASQRCYSDVCCNCHEAHQCHCNRLISKSQHLASYISRHNAMAYDRASESQI